MKNTVPITLIIPTFNRYNSLKETILSYLGANTLPNEIIIVDQSKDEIFLLNANFIEDIKRSVNYLSIKHIKLFEPSITKARNIGIKNSINELICFSDDDIELVNDVILNVYNLMSNDNIGLIAGYDVNSTGGKASKIKRLVKCFFCFDNFFGFKKGRVNPAYFGILPENLQGSAPTNWAMGFFFTVKKTLIIDNDIWFDEKLCSYAYAEDLDFSYRYCSVCKKIKLKTVFNSSVVVLHKCSKEYRVPQINNITRVFINRYYLFNKIKPNFIKKIKYFICTQFYRFLLKKTYGEMSTAAYKIFRKKRKSIMFIDKFTDNFYI